MQLAPQHDAEEKADPKGDAERLGRIALHCIFDCRQHFVRRILGSVGLMSAGLRNRADIWSVKPDAGEAVFPYVAAFARVCAYDRPGTTLGADHFSRSDPVSMARTAADAVAELHAVLGAEQSFRLTCWWDIRQED